MVARDGDEGPGCQVRRLWHRNVRHSAKRALRWCQLSPPPKTPHFETFARPSRLHAPFFNRARSMLAWGVALGGFAAYRMGFFSRGGEATASSPQGQFSQKELDEWNAKLQKEAHVRAAPSDKDSAAIIARAEAAKAAKQADGSARR